MKFGGSKSVNINGQSSKNGSQLQQTASSQRKDPDLKRQVLCVSGARDACVEGLNGSFFPVENDFTPHHLGEKDGWAEDKEHFRNDPYWNTEKRERVKRFRFVICILGMLAMTLAYASRVILFVAIAAMVRTKAVEDVGPPINAQNYSTELPEMVLIASLNDTATLDFGVESELGLDTNEEILFDWSGREQNMVLGAFHLGYIPSMLLSGGIADKYGPKWPLFASIFGSFLINFLTPFLASQSIYLLIGARILLGSLQGGTIPSIYELFNKWLTLTETSIFVPLFKVSSAAGAFLGSSLPGVITSFGYKWPCTFYFASSLCFIWSIVWLLLATSTPQTNPFVESNELHRIMRKKKVPVTNKPTEILVDRESQANNKLATIETANGSTKSKPATGQDNSTPADSIPWMLIIKSPSVLALTLVKFTYNSGIEFLSMEMAVYMKHVYGASETMTGPILAGGALVQMALITFVGWSAQAAVGRELLGIKRTSWRKIFQGLSNFGMCFSYLMLALMANDLFWDGFIIITIHFCWIFGAAGESMVPYDLSFRYPATIMGLAHGISVFSGLAIPSVSGVVLGDNLSDPERWNFLFLLLAVATGFGGLVFSLVLKAEPFLPGEKVP